MKYFYRAWCRACGLTRKESYTSGFLSYFFLGSRCRHCGAYHSEYGDDKWKTGYGRFERDRKFILKHPSTWFGLWVWKEKE